MSFVAGAGGLAGRPDAGSGEELDSDVALLQTVSLGFCMSVLRRATYPERRE